MAGSILEAAPDLFGVPPLVYLPLVAALGLLLLVVRRLLAPQKRGAEINMLAPSHVEHARVKTEGKQVSVAVIGGGMSGSCAAYFLRQMLPEEKDLRIVIVESAEELGGRVGTIELCGHRFEAGASIVHDSNLYAASFAKKYGLEQLREVSSGAHVCFYDGQKVQVHVSGLASIFGMLGRFGLGTLLRMGKARDAAMNLFEKIYGMQDGSADTPPRAFDTPHALLSTLGGQSYYDLTQVSSREFHTANHPACPKNWRLSADLSDTLITGGTRMNYGQTPDTLPAFTVLVSLAGTQHERLWKLRGGNAQIVELAAKASKADVWLGTRVSSVRPGGGGGWDVSCSGAVESFDAVVVACPLEGAPFALSLGDAEAEGRVKDYCAARSMHTTVATFVRGTLSAKLLERLGYGDGRGMIPSVIMTTRGAALGGSVKFSSIGLQFPVDMPSDDAKAYARAAVGPVGGGGRPDAFWKVFSNARLSGEDLAELFAQPPDGSWDEHSARGGGGRRLLVKEWRAYPEYVSPKEQFLPFRLAPGVAYSCALERAASAVEMACVAGRNAALLIREELIRTGKAKPL